MLCFWKSNDGILSNNLDNVHFQLCFYILQAVQTSHIVHSAKMIISKITPFFLTLLFHFLMLRLLVTENFSSCLVFALVFVCLYFQD